RDPGEDADGADEVEVRPVDGNGDADGAAPVLLLDEILDRAELVVSAEGGLADLDRFPLGTVGAGVDHAGSNFQHSGSGRRHPTQRPTLNPRITNWRAFSHTSSRIPSHWERSTATTVSEHTAASGMW